jgi:prephenate dehydrogenase
MSEENKQAFQNITIIGVGLIGGSLALAIKQRYPAARITGVDRPEVIRKAIKRNAIDKAGKNLRDGCRNADLVLMCVPVRTITELMPVVADSITPSTLVTDAGSVKYEIVRKAERLFPDGNFIGGHPMAGSELVGIEAANPLLFQNAIYILTPSKKTKKSSVRRLANFYESLDARVLLMDASAHDSVVSAVSHLPQLAAVALTNTIGKFHKMASSHLTLAAGGFRDMTRIASSPYSIWESILIANKKETGKSLRLFIKQLEKMAESLDSNPARLAGDFRDSRKLRSRIPRSMKGFLSPLVELSIFLEDKPGELARLTASLAKGNINIKDLELLKVREGRGGTFRLSFENRTVASQAALLLQKEGFDVSGN